MIAIALVVLLMAIGGPSMHGQLSRQKLQASFDRFDTLVVEAQRRSVNDGEPYVLVWQPNGSVALYPVAWNTEQRRKRAPAATWDPGRSNERYTLLRPSSLAAQPAAEWTFWPTGNCEPVAVRYKGSPGVWEAAYNPLSGRGTLSTFLAQ